MCSGEFTSPRGSVKSPLRRAETVQAKRKRQMSKPRRMIVPKPWRRWERKFGDAKGRLQVWVCCPSLQACYPAQQMARCAEQAGEKRHHVASRCGIQTTTIRLQNRMSLYNGFRRKCARTSCQLLLHLSTLNPDFAIVFGLQLARVSSWCV